MGMLDSGSSVLTDSSAAAGWRVIAFFEVSLTLGFVYWFWTKGKTFQEYNTWTPNNNITPLRKVVVDVKAGLYKPVFMVKSFFKKKASICSISHGPSKALSNKEGAKQDRSEGAEWPEKVALVPFEKANFIEGLYALVAEGRKEVGSYAPKLDKGHIVEEGTDVNHPWGRHFNKFTPFHKYYYFVGIAKVLSSWCSELFILSSY